MKQKASFFALLVALVISPLSGAAQEQGYWKATNNTAHSITGDISMSSDKLMINFAMFTMFRARTLKPEEARGTFDLPEGAAGVGAIYRLNIPGNKKFLHKNTLCGAEDVQWMATYTDGKSLNVILFSGQQLPVFTHEGMVNSTQVCGTFLYSR